MIKNDIDSRIDSFERILDLAERVKDLNQARIREYLDTVSAIKKMNNLTMENFMSSDDKNTGYEKVYSQFNDTLKNIDKNPPSEPTAPGVNPYIEQQRAADDAKLDKISRMSSILTEQLRANVDFHKHANEALVESQRKAFELFKEFDGYVRGRK